PIQTSWGPDDDLMHKQLALLKAQHEFNLERIRRSDNLRGTRGENIDGRTTTAVTGLREDYEDENDTIFVMLCFIDDDDYAVTLFPEPDRVMVHVSLDSIHELPAEQQNRSRLHHVLDVARGFASIPWT
ncbi:hypothetical protein BGZ83_001521, partial [Gryganskiella cystojenkinii]